MDLPTRSDLLAVGRRAVRSAPQTRVNPLTYDVDGSDLNLTGNIAALMGEELARAFQRCNRGNFVGTARRELLDKVIMDRTGGQLPRKDASPARVDLTLTRPTFAGGAGIVTAGQRVITDQGTAFQIDSDVVFGGTDLTKPAQGTCTETGPDGNAAAGAITRFQDVPFDATIVPSNAAGAAGGSDVEDDIRYSARYFGFFPTLSKGVIGAIRFGALEVAGVAIASAFEVVNTFGIPAAAVSLIVGDEDGNASGGMLQAVRDKMLDFRSAGIPVFVSGGVVAFEAVSWSGLRYASGIDTTSAQDAVRGVTVAVSQFLGPGETLHRSTLIAAARAVPGVVIPEGALAVPTGDIVPVNSQTVIRVRAQDIVFE